MKTVFADTSFYIAVLNTSDSSHKQASELSADYDGTIVTTAWVLTELGSYFSDVRNRRGLLGLFEALQTPPDVVIRSPNPLDFEKGLALFSQRLDKSWSLVDCISFAIIRDQLITDAWTSDHHFQQAGFNALLI